VTARGDRRRAQIPRESGERRRGWLATGINPKNTLGVSVPSCVHGSEDRARPRARPRAVGVGIHEARSLAGLVDDPAKVTEAQVERWAKDFDSGHMRRGLQQSLRTGPVRAAKAAEWSAREEEYVKRAGFVLMAALAVHDKKAPDACSADS